MGVGSWVRFGAEGVKGGLMAGGWGWLVGFASVAFGMGGWEWVVVGADGWLLTRWLRLGFF